jgi:hypothetical protein
MSATRGSPQSAAPNPFVEHSSVSGIRTAPRSGEFELSPFGAGDDLLTVVPPSRPAHVITPAEVSAARLAREAARAARADAARMRLIVCGIWAFALTLAATLGFVAIRS